MTNHGKRPSGTDNRYRFVGLRQFDAYETRMDRWRDRIGLRFRALQKHVISLEERLAVLESWAGPGFEKEARSEEEK